MIPHRRPLAIRAAALTAAAAAVLALSACSGAAGSGAGGRTAHSDRPSASASGAPSPSPGAGSSPVPTGGSGSSGGAGSTQAAATKPGGTALSMTCDQLLTPDQLYAFNPNFGDDPGYQPAAGSLAATAVADKGVACAYLNQSSGAVIQLSVAQPDQANLTALENAAVTTSTAVPTYGVPQGYFSTARGEAQVFTGPYWIAAVAPTNTFGEPGDPAPLIQSIQQNLAAR